MSIFHPDGTVRPGRVWLYFLLSAAVILAAVWGGRVYSARTSQARGTLSIQAQRGSAENRTHWSAVFTQLYNNIQADQANIKIAAGAAAAKNSTILDAANLQGVRQNCDQDVADWNADLANVLAVVPSQYPQNRLDPLTVCAADPDTTGFLNP